jgi:single-strand DNA-binding protein
MNNQQHRNEVHLRGVLARDPEIRYTRNGKAVASFTVATTYEKRTEYHRCTAWEDVAERLGEHFKKDNFISLSGRLQTRSYDKNGEKRYVTEVIAWNVGDGAKEKPLTPNLERNLHGVQVTDDDIPF